MDSTINLKPIVYKINDMIDASIHTPPQLLEFGIAFVKGYFLALDGFTLYLGDKLKFLVVRACDILRKIAKEYTQSIEADRFFPQESDLKELKAISNELLKINFHLPKKDFLHGFLVSICALKEKVKHGCASIDEAHAQFGIVSAFGLIDYCTQVGSINMLIQHMGSYANSWPAKFAFKSVEQSLLDVMDEEKKGAA
ncbi:MAG: hypothetical protein K9M07_07135 [Simkaniaceae bacterium]|nr:hypothetical protein [Simkaniaceae bacterium]